MRGSLRLRHSQTCPAREAGRTKDPRSCSPPSVLGRVGSVARSLGTLPRGWRSTDLLEFERRLFELREQVLSGKPPRPTRPITLDEFVGPWFEKVALQVELGRMSPLTFNNYEGDWRRHLRPAFGVRPPADRRDRPGPDRQLHEDQVRRRPQREHRQELARRAERDAHRCGHRGSHPDEPAEDAEAGPPPWRKPPRSPRPPGQARHAEAPRGQRSVEVARRRSRALRRHGPARPDHWLPPKRDPRPPVGVDRLRHDAHSICAASSTGGASRESASASRRSCAASTTASERCRCTAD